MKKYVLIIAACVICFCVKAEESMPIPQRYESIARLLNGSDSIVCTDNGSTKFMLVDTVVLHNYTTYTKNTDVMFAFPATATSRTAKYLLHNKDSYLLLRHWRGASGIIRLTDISSDECLWEADENITTTIYGLVFFIRRDYFDLNCVPVYDRRTFPCARRRMKYYRAILPVCKDFYIQYVRSGLPIQFCIYE